MQFVTMWLKLGFMMSEAGQKRGTDAEGNLKYIEYKKYSNGIRMTLGNRIREFL